MVKHDSDITTVYGNLGETLVNIDQKVEEGEVIGKITTEENSSISFLHFEIRINASPRDPLSYLTKKY
ncbi:M23 family metallopeptidase [Candidatus Desantisbacteria bacterium]|nr:M23 family metallopeptidase [Candidatus Desantisbacteria bacterium]